MVQNDNPGGESPGGPFAGKPPLALIGAVVAVIAIGVVLAVVAFGGGGGGGSDNDDNDGTSAESGGLADDIPEPTVEATIDLNRPTATAQHLESVGEGDRLVISKFNVNAPLSFKTVGLDGQMPNPNGPDDVVYYNFSAWPGKGGAPGKGGNTVLSGHVDSGLKACKNGTVPPPCEAVFWDINRLRIGDEIEVHLSGVIHRYRVTSNQPVPAATGPWDQIVSATVEETITLITCGGDFNRETREYNNRQVVTATRI
jgi:LPXTG-site transpeptidase (sortase) family protein